MLEGWAASFFAYDPVEMRLSSVGKGPPLMIRLDYWLCALALWTGACAGAGAQAESPAATDGSATNTATSAATQDASTSEATPRDQPPRAETRHRAPPPEGTKNLDRRGLTMEFGLTLLDGDTAAGVQTGQWSFEEERTHRVHQVDDEFVTALEVVYGKWDAKPLLGLVYEVPTDGKTYLVKDSGASTAGVTRPGQPMTSVELNAVQSEYGYVGGANPLLSAIDAAGGPGSELVTDERVTAALIGAIPGVATDEAHLDATLDSMDGDQAKLTLRYEATLKSGPTLFTLTLDGVANVDLQTGWVTSLKLEGPALPSGQLKVNRRVLDVRGRGSAKLHRESQRRE